MSDSSSTSTQTVSHDRCVAAAVSILGDKWTPHLIRALSQQSLRFCRLQDEAGGVNPRTLSARLSRLEEMGIVTKVVHAQVPPHVEYSLTPKGQDLVPILERMAAWGEKYHASTATN